MLRWHTLALVALAGLLTGGEMASAQIIVRAPFVDVQVGPTGVHVRAPFVQVDVEKNPRMLVGQPPVVVGEPLPRPMPPVGTGPGVVDRPMTIKDFASTFRPSAGTHQAVLVHPTTGQPVTVQFTLPAGAPEVRVTGKRVEFDYGKTEIDIRFNPSGGVKVDYLD